MGQVDLLDGFSPAAIAQQNGYAQGSMIGKRFGREEGYRDGYADGVNQAQQASYNNGHNQGEVVGYNNGYHNGHIDGKQAGYQEGYAAAQAHGNKIIREWKEHASKLAADNLKMVAEVHRLREGLNKVLNVLNEQEKAKHTQPDSLTLR